MAKINLQRYGLNIENQEEWAKYEALLSDLPDGKAEALIGKWASDNLDHDIHVYAEQYDSENPTTGSQKAMDNAAKGLYNKTEGMGKEEAQAQPQQAQNASESMYPNSNMKQETQTAKPTNTYAERVINRPNQVNIAEQPAAEQPTSPAQSLYSNSNMNP